MKNNLCSWDERLHIFTISLLPDLIHNSSEILNKILDNFIDINQLILKFIWKQKRSSIAHTILKKNKGEDIISDFKYYYETTLIKTSGSSERIYVQVNGTKWNDQNRLPRILTLESSLSHSYKAKPQLTYDPKVILLGVNLTDFKHISTENLAHRCLYHIYSQSPKTGTNQVVLQSVNE